MPRLLGERMRKRLMDRIVTMHHLNAYTGRFAAQRHRRPAEKKTGWDVEGSFLEKTQYWLFATGTWRTSLLVLGGGIET